MKVIKTDYGKGIFLSDAELLALGFIAVNLLGLTGISFMDDYAKKTSPTLLSDAQLSVLAELLEAIRKESDHG